MVDPRARHGGPEASLAIAYLLARALDHERSERGAFCGLQSGAGRGVHRAHGSLFLRAQVVGCQLDLAALEGYTVPRQFKKCSDTASGRQHQNDDKPICGALAASMSAAGSSRVSVACRACLPGGHALETQSAGRGPAEYLLSTQPSNAPAALEDQSELTDSPALRLIELARQTYSSSPRRYCKQIKSCEEARCYLENCPWGRRLDRDGDGVPCEDPC
ncbi:excalibur calcium-binding domain-containing protein [Paracoccus aminophilus]